MSNFKRSWLLMVVTMISGVIVSACDSGGGGNFSADGAPGSELDNQSNGQNDGAPVLGTGAPLIGRMVGRRPGADALGGLDMETGRYYTLPGTSDIVSVGALRNEARTQARRDRSVPSGMLLTVDDCLEQQELAICFFFLDQDGRQTRIFAINGDYPGPGKVSFDGSHVAVNRSDRAEGLSAMTIFTREGEFVSVHFQSGYMARSGPYDWLPDGRLVYAMEGNQLLGDTEVTGFFISDPFDATPSRQVVLPDYYQGLGSSIKTIETSPDGTQLLINLEPVVGPVRPILVDVNTLAVTPLIERESDPVFDARDVTWGPDGRWIYVTVATSELLSGTSLDSSQGGTIVFIGSSDSLFAYEVNGMTHPMPLDPEDLSDSVRLIPTENASNPGGAVGGGQYSGSMAWIP